MAHFAGPREAIMGMIDNLNALCIASGLDLLQLVQERQAARSNPQHPQHATSARTQPAAPSHSPAAAAVPSDQQQAPEPLPQASPQAAASAEPDDAEPVFAASPAREIEPAPSREPVPPAAKPVQRRQQPLPASSQPVQPAQDKDRQDLAGHDLAAEAEEDADAGAQEDYDDEDSEVSMCSEAGYELDEGFEYCYVLRDGKYKKMAPTQALQVRGLPHVSTRDTSALLPRHSTGGCVVKGTNAAIAPQIRLSVCVLVCTVQVGTATWRPMYLPFWTTSAAMPGTVPSDSYTCMQLLHLIGTVHWS